MRRPESFWKAGRTVLKGALPGDTEFAGHETI